MQPGFAIIYANQLETLAEIAFSRCDAEPLPPLEEDIVLVQSNGMADWLKLQQAQRNGISASMRFPMPASFLWEMYQRVLSPELLGTPSPFNKSSLQWRIFRLLPQLVERPEFARPAGFLADANDLTKRFQLARKLADLLDQYQLYRSDWLLQWEAGKLCNLGEDEAWQASLWQALIADIPAAERQRSRAHLHRAFMRQVESGQAQGLPKRIILFGISSLPKQLLEALYALSNHCQLLLLMLNPSQDYWASKEADDTLANPLLNNWGAQGRDFIRLLLEYEPPESQRLQSIETEIFLPAAEATRSDSIISDIQQAILDNAPTAAEKQPLPNHPGLTFLPAYSRQREVEILHDKLLALFADQPDLRYGDVLVMTPNIDLYSAHIEAVFNRFPHHDSRHLDYAISDRHQVTDSPLFMAVSYLLELPHQRLTQSELQELLSLPSVQAVFQLDDAALELVARWIEQSHIRWGLDGSHKASAFNLPDNACNTWRAGIDQLLAGYCAGDTPLWDDLANVDEVSANQGEALGQLSRFIDQIDAYRKRLAQSHTPAEWQVLFSQLLEAFFLPQDSHDRELLASLQQALNSWQEDCALADFDAPLPLAQARSGWLDKVQQSGLSQQLAFRGITFCTLMPMRALPFKQVFLLGMGDGEYPRETVQPDFDLMQNGYRPGDRDRRNDDQYLFLEALLSVRDSLTISWVGHNIRNNEAIPASILVEQVRNYVDANWTAPDGGKASDYLTEELPLATFSRRYFEAENTPPTYNSEWFSLYNTTPAADNPAPFAPIESPSELHLSQWVSLLRQPVNVFFEQRLRCRFEDLAEQGDDTEPFDLDNLQAWQLRQTFVDHPSDDWPQLERRQLASGELPAGHFASPYLSEAKRVAGDIQGRFQASCGAAKRLPPQTLSLTATAGEHSAQWDVTLDNLWQAESNGERFLADMTASNLKAKKKQWRYDKLCKHWLKHLAAQAAGLAWDTHLVGRDAQAHFTAIDAAEAQQQLNAIYAIWLEACSRPLPVGRQAALSWLAGGDYTDCQKAFDKDYEDATVQRAFSDFDDIWPGATQEPPFAAWAQHLYGALFATLNTKEDAA